MQTGSNLERSPCQHVTVQKRTVTRALGILLQYAVYDCTAIRMFLYECPCLLSFMPTWQMQVYSTLNRHLLNHVGPWRSCGVCTRDMKSIFMLSKMHCRLHSGCCIHVRRTCPSVRCVTSASDGLGDSSSFLWLRENSVVVSFVHVIITLSLLCC